MAFPATVRGAAAWQPVVRGISFQVAAGELVGLVGESGSGKSITALTIMGLVPTPGRVLQGSLRFQGQELVGLPEKQRRKFRGGKIGIVFQEPMTALNPVLTIGAQIIEGVRQHRSLGRAAAREEAARLLDLVAIPDPLQRLKDYPHQLSGGQRQRAMIAMALAGEPELLLADEPTTALDVTIQAQILELLQQLRSELGLAVILITHDLAVVAETCERVLVMYAGEVVEKAPARRLFGAPAHPYTRGLLGALPHLGNPAPRGQLTAIPGQVPEPAHRPTGCAFHPRCDEAFEPCPVKEPAAYDLGGGQQARCFLHRPEGSA